MLRITDMDGVDLIQQPPLPQVLTADAANGTGIARVSCLIAHTEVLPVGSLRAFLCWNDGTPAVEFASAGTLAVDVTRHLAVGVYTVRLEAQDYVPVEQRCSVQAGSTASVNFQVSVQPPVARASSALIYGPILPKDEGFPGTSQWSWDRGEDLEILASSVKMLLNTSKGERIMLPDYGTRLRLILFEPLTAALDGLVRQEITQALAAWEPRVDLNFLSVNRTGDREVTVYATFVSRLTGSDFALNLPFASR